MNYSVIGQRLRELRGEESMEKTAQAIGVSKSALSMHERGQRGPRDEIKVRIAQYFNQTVEAIFYSNRARIVLKRKEGKG